MLSRLIDPTWPKRVSSGWLLLPLAWCYVFLFVIPPFLKEHWASVEGFFGNSKTLLGVLLPWGVHGVQLLLINAYFGCLYAANLPFFEQYRIIKDKPWPWRDEDPAVRSLFWKTLRGGIARVAFNNFAVALPAAYLTFNPNLISSDVESFPDGFTIAWQILVCLLIEDTLFYHIHKTLHHPSIFRFVHKSHHEFHHSIALASENAHWFEYLVGNLIPVVLGPVILRAHIVTYAMFIVVRIAETGDAHSGYDMPWNLSHLLPFSSPVAAHDFHHSNTNGCYGSQFTFWDYVWGTDEESMVEHAKVRAEARARAAAAGASGGDKTGKNKDA